MDIFAAKEKAKPDIKNLRLKLGSGQAYDSPCD
jgi:hypothetical protein